LEISYGDPENKLRVGSGSEKVEVATKGPYQILITVTDPDGTIFKATLAKGKNLGIEKIKPSK
jgi:hypothetical protein